MHSRLGEVLIHHVDLDLGYGPDGWPTAFVRDMLPRIAYRLTERALAPLSAHLNATDTGRSFQIGGHDAEQINGTEAELMAWLLGRSDGAGLHRDKSWPVATRSEHLLHMRAERHLSYRCSGGSPSGSAVRYSRGQRQSTNWSR